MLKENTSLRAELDDLKKLEALIQTKKKQREKALVIEKLRCKYDLTLLWSHTKMAKSISKLIERK